MESLITNCRRLNLSFTVLLIGACFFYPVQVLNAQPIVLENDQLRVELSQSQPSADRYVLKSNDQVIYGHISYYSYWTQVFHEGNLHYSYPSVDSITKTSDRVCYHLRGELDSQQAVTFDLCYTLSGNSVELSFGNISEMPGYKLIVVRPPDLLNVRADQGGAKLVFPYAEGRLIDVATTNTGDWNDGATGGMLHTMLMGMLYHQGALAVCSYDNVDMVLEERVFDHLGDRLGAIDIFFYYRHPPTNFELATFVDVFDEHTTSLSVKLSFLADYDQDGDIDWIDGAKFLRDQVQAVPDPRYLSSWITKLNRYEDATILEQLRTIEKLYHLTDHNKIYSYLMQYGPIFSVFGYDGDIDPQYASYEDLKQVFETAEKRFNTFLSFNDVYLDYYPGTPYYDPALRVLYPWGEFMGGWPLPGYSGAYRADPYDYAVQFGLQRVRNTLSRYPIKKSHHIDAFHFFPDKDHSLGSPASREKNRRGLKLIINEFNKYGVDVTAEGLTGFFVGPGTGWFLDTPRIFEDNLPWFEKEIIPLIEFIYHGKTLYGLYEDIYYTSLPPEQVQVYAFLEPLLLGASSAAHITFTSRDDLELDKFYLIDLPWMALNQRFMQDYIAAGDYRRITYGANTFVEINYKTNTYTVQVDGKVIGQNYMTFYPKDSLTFLIYSRNAKTISCSLPRVWTKENASLVKLTETGVKVPVPFEIVDNKIEFNAEANTPYKLTRNPNIVQKPVTLPWLLLLLD